MLTGPPGIFEETKRSVERPPSRLSAVVTFQGVGEFSERVLPRSAREQAEVLPNHQRVFPSVSRMERTAILVELRPRTGLLFSMRRGPAWRRCEAEVLAGREERRRMAGSWFGFWR